ncbi:MAG TPA: copper chaperone PCu(A)C [Reyranella sp.]|jgi:copper(I)-binding protein|nr:copper chaperone PCu(A)C [Reyranella sp.]
MLHRRSLLVIAASLVSSSAALAQSYKVGGLVIDQPWARATAPGASSGGAFLKISNTGMAADRLVSVSTPAADKAQVHQTRMEGNVMRMRELDHGLEIAPGATVSLEPGHFHIMLMGLKAPLIKGAKVPLTLVFEKAGKVDIKLDVVAMGAMPSMPGMKGN